VTPGRPAAVDRTAVDHAAVDQAAVADAVADAHRSEWAFVLAATVRVTGDLDLAQECAQDAYVTALDRWGTDGIPRRPGAWLTTTARHRALDQLRRESTLRRKLPLLIEPDQTVGLVAPPAGPDDPDRMLGPDETPGGVLGGVPDDRLRLVFTCCHPALAAEAQVALTLRLVCGVPTGQIARAFLVSEPTMAARITRAKKKIATARIPYRVPSREELPERLDSVLTALHLLFSTGHTPSEGDEVVRTDLCERAIDLARTLVTLLPAEPEPRGLLGLLLLGHARRATRTDDQGRLMLLPEQDRSRWDPTAMLYGLRFTAEALNTPGHGRFTLQAAIAGVHTVAPAFEQTDWPRIVMLYDRLLAVWDSPVVALNRAAAVSFAAGPDAALALVDELAGDPRLADYPYLPATRADLLRRLDRTDEAARAYRSARALTRNAVEQAYLDRRLADLADLADLAVPSVPPDDVSRPGSRSGSPPGR
jgi:RNA polymerase sigma-70 factor (ECF subfamily)